MVGNHALELPLSGELHVTELESGGVLRHLSALGPDVRLVVDFRVVQVLVVLLPGERHGRVTGAGCRAHEGHVGAFNGRLGFGLHRDLRLGEVVCKHTKKQQQGAQWDPGLQKNTQNMEIDS